MKQGKRCPIYQAIQDRMATADKEAVFIEFQGPVDSLGRRQFGQLWWDRPNQEWRGNVQFGDPAKAVEGWATAGHNCVGGKNDPKAMSIIYNEFDPFACEWLRNLAAAEYIAFGEVLERDIRVLQPDDVVGATQFHAFAGVGGWSHALWLAGWPDDKPVWTGSCPCQPFSVAGKRKGTDDERHLWPEWFRLIKVCRPSVLFGEQVASPAGRVWLDNVSLDLEALGYAIGSADLGAACVGAPHIRQRLWFVAYADGISGNKRSQDTRRRAQGSHAQQGSRLGGGSRVGGGFWADAEWIPCRDGKARPVEPGTFPLVARLPSRLGRVRTSGALAPPSRSGMLRGYGNAIVPQVAATFIRAAMEILP